MTPRQPGAQPGNLNALKHGFYSRRFSDMERLDLEALMEDGLDSEIAMLRVATRRVFDLANGVESLEKASELLGTLSMAAGKLSGMLRVRALLGTKQPDFFRDILFQRLSDLGNNVINRSRERLHLKPPVVQAQGPMFVSYFSVVWQRLTA
jgi:hypothetical protein